MRVLTLALALCALTSVAHADDDDDDDEDGAFVALPKRSIGIRLAGHGMRIAGRSESGFGPALELALGRDRWQYLVEGGIAMAGIDSATADVRVGGRLMHTDLGARWLARQFQFDDTGGVELFLQSFVGVQHVSFDDNTRRTRPELALGFGIQVRTFHRPRLAFRLDARVLFTPDDREDMRETASTTGFSSGIGFAW